MPALDWFHEEHVGGCHEEQAAPRVPYASAANSSGSTLPLDKDISKLADRFQACQAGLRGATQGETPWPSYGGGGVVKPPHILQEQASVFNWMPSNAFPSEGPRLDHGIASPHDWVGATNDTGLHAPSGPPAPSPGYTSIGGWLPPSGLTANGAYHAIDGTILSQSAPNGAQAKVTSMTASFFGRPASAAPQPGYGGGAAATPLPVVSGQVEPVCGEGGAQAESV